MSKLQGSSVEEEAPISDVSSIKNLKSDGSIKLIKKRAVDEMYQPDVDVLKTWIKKPHMKVENIMEEF